MSEITIEALMEAGVAFGHNKTKKHPKMSDYVEKTQNDLNFINLERTKEKLEKALKVVEEIAEKGGNIVFVATKPTAQAIVEKYAKEADMPYIINKWVAGTLTNFETIYMLIKKMLTMEAEQLNGEWNKYTKKEMVTLEKELQRLNKMVGGLRSLDKIPNALYIVDLIKEKTAVKEAKKRGVTTIGLADTNTNPESITYHIPANDDGIKSIDFITKLMVEAIKNGRAIRLAHRATAEGQAQDSAPRQGSGQAPRQGSGQEKKDETKTESTK